MNERLWVRDGAGWHVRVTPDKQPLLHIEGDLGRRGAGSGCGSLPCAGIIRIRFQGFALTRQPACGGRQDP